MPVIRLIAGSFNSGNWLTLSFAAGAFNSLADGSFVRFTDTIDNATNLDLMLDMEGEVTVGGTTVARSHMGVYALPARSDSRYGDDTPSGANPPNSAYLASILGARTGVTSGNPAYLITPAHRPIILGRGVHMLGVQSRMTVALNGTPAAAFRVRATNLQTV